MWFLTLELWPYVAAAFAIGVLTGWLSGCSPSRRADRPDAEAAR
ncbi:hypothetical protein [Ancylobacter radicis]|nr:hypothetical protein [Ancylobacter radicis]